MAATFSAAFSSSFDHCGTVFSSAFSPAFFHCSGPAIDSVRFGELELKWKTRAARLRFKLGSPEVV
jgi:hypothetical protein